MRLLPAASLIAVLASQWQACTPDCARIDWGGKGAHRCCQAAIEDPARTTPPTCSALHMCANEAALTPDLAVRLKGMMHAHGCDPP